MSTKRTQTGAYGEQIAAHYLVRQGYQILAQNWRCPEGELDVVAKQGNTLVFVEVRTRRGSRMGTPEESVTWAKQQKLIQLADAFLADYDNPDCDWRIDVIAVVLDKQDEVVRLNHIEAAVGEI